MNGAVALWVRADWRRRRRLIVALAMLIGLAGAVVLTAFAGARRTASSVDRLERETGAADIMVDVSAVDPLTADAITRLPMVEASGAFTIVFALVDGVEADLGLFVPRDDRFGAEIERYRVLRGRRPAPDRPDEVAINEPALAILGVDIGDEVSIATLTPEQVRDEEYFPPRGPQLDVHVVGVLRGVDDLDDGADGGFFMSQALYGTVQGKVDEFATYLAIGLTEGATVADFDTAVADLIPPGQEYQTLTGDTRAHAARGTISSLASGLTILALVAALAAMMAIGQAVGRHVSAARTDAETLSGLGITRSGRIAALVLVTLPSALCGAALAAVAAWLASPIMPIGLARRADPDPGLSADWTVLGVGAIAIVIIVLVTSTLGATWLTRPRAATRAASGSSAVTAVLSHARGGPVVANGAHLALDQRAPALPARSAIAGFAVAILGCIAVLTCAASLDRLVATPARWGYGWDVLLNFTSDEVDAAAERIVGDDRVAASARWDGGFSYVGNLTVRAFGLTPLEGDIGFSLRSGRQPVSPGEVVLGGDTAKRLGVHLGDRVEVAPDSNATDTSSVIVVGTALFPYDGDGSFTRAIGYYGPAFAEHAVAPDLFEASQIVVRLAPDLDVDQAAASLNDDYLDSVSGESLPTPPAEVANLAGVRSLPIWLAAFVALLGVASLGHVLLTTLWRRKRELATLRSLGLTPRQTVACIVWQAVTIALVGLAIGIPLGLIAGNGAWFAITDPIGVATDVDRPELIYAVTGCLALLVAAVIALLPGWRAAHLPLAEALHVE